MMNQSLACLYSHAAKAAVNEFGAGRPDGHACYSEAASQLARPRSLTGQPEAISLQNRPRDIEEGGESPHKCSRKSVLA
jgi:hypothetical protein